MKRFLVSYDLRAPHKDYTTLHNHLRNDYAASKKPLASVWILKSTLAYDDIRNAIKHYIDDDDKLLVIDITGQASAWFNIAREDLNF